MKSLIITYDAHSGLISIHPHYPPCPFFRPNPIGLSLVKIENIVGDTVHLSGIDVWIILLCFT